MAENLDDAYEKVMRFYNNEPKHDVKPYFKQNYYDKLKEYFAEVINKQ